MIPLLAGISAQSLVGLLVWIIVLGLIFWLLTWLIGYAGVPEPFAKVLKVIVAVFAVLVLINLLLGLTGHAVITW